jgi:K319-like protein
MAFAIRVSTSFLVLFSLLIRLQDPAWAYSVQAQGGTSAVAIRFTTPPQSFNTGPLNQTSYTTSISSSAVCTGDPAVCPLPVGASANAQATLFGTVSMGTLSAIARGSANVSSPSPVPPANYTAGGTFIWQDNVTITQTGDFKMTLTLDSSVSASWPPGFSCQTGEGPAGATVTLQLTGPTTLTINDSVCEHPATRIVTGTFHGIAGQVYPFSGRLIVNAGGRADLFQVAPSASVSVSSSADAAHTGIFKLDPVTPGAAYTTESGVSYGSVIPNQLPVANAGTDQTVRVGSSVSLDGTGSADPDGNTPLTFAWTLVSKPSGSNATLSNPSDSMPSFTADKVGDYRFSLTVTDSLGASSLPAEVKISTTNSSPIADAGPDQAVVALGTTIHLNGAQSYDPDGDVITYTWSLAQMPTGSAATLSSASAVAPTFTADVQGTYVATLVVRDIHGALSDADSVTVSFTNVKPIANGGGNQAGSVGQTIGLNGSRSSDANLDRLTYSWTFVSKPSSSVAALTNPAGAVTQFTADRAGTYIVSLVVNDGLVDSDPDTVTVTITSRQDQVIQSLRQAITVINGLSLTVFKNHNMPNALTNKINAALEDIDQGLYQQALSKLRDDILAKTGGCAIAGTPDKNDWITNCGAQAQVSAPINQAITLLQGM